MRLFVLRFCAGLFCAATLWAPPLTVWARPVAAEDLFVLRLVSDTQISPDGRYVAFAVSKMDGPQNAYFSNIWLADIARTRVHQISGGNHDSSPNWSPDGRTLLFTRIKQGKPQIYQYDVLRKATHQLTSLTAGAASAKYSHDGKHIAFGVTTKDDEPKAYIDFNAAGFKPKKNQRNSDVRIITKFHFQANGVGETFFRHAHIWIMDSDGSHPRALTSGHEFSEGDIEWSPDDRTIAFTSLRRESVNLGPSDVYSIPVSGGAMRLLQSDQQSNTSPAWGHRNDRLWYFANNVEDPAEYPALISARLDGRGKRELIGKNKVAWGDIVITDAKEPGGLCGPLFDPQDRFMVLDVNGPGYSKLVKIDTDTGSMHDLTGNSGEVSECTLSADGRRVAYTFADFLHPAEVYTVQTSGGPPKALSVFNEPYLHRVALSRPQSFSVKDPAGFDVRAWFMPAINARGKRHPTLLDIHGGPQTQFGESFFHEFQYWAGLGYNVVFSDPRGSVGFGYPFQEALAKNWGNAMFEDVSAVMDEVIKRPDVDPDRTAVLGGSYGGYATLWVISHTNRFKAAIAERVVSNLATEQLVADLASRNALGGAYSWGLPWEAGNKYAEQSPLSFVASVNTPLLLLHATNDTRTPIDQTLQEYSALKILGKPVTYVEFPRENHDLSRTGEPIHRVERLHILSDWMKRYLKP